VHGVDDLRGFSSHSQCYYLPSTYFCKPGYKRTWLQRKTREEYFRPILVLLRKLQSCTSALTDAERTELKAFEDSILLGQRDDHDVRDDLCKLLKPIGLRLHEAEQRRFAAERREQADKNRLCELKRQHERAAKAATMSEHRVIAEEVKRGLRVTSECPYCDGPMIGPHADHIVSLSMHGLSEESNLVYICWKCNVSKGGGSLRAFAEKRGYSFEAIRVRLLKLGKNVPG
jgi:5-methylcytosine-specific restriction endonuclease McrA